MRPRRYPRAKRVALQLLQWYPGPWRARYFSEMRALLEEIPVGWGQAANVATGAVREWLSPRAVGWPARTAAGRLLVRRGVLFMAGAYALDGIVRVVAARMHAAGIVQLDSLDTIDGVLFIFVVFRLTAAVFNSTRLPSRTWRRTVTWWRRPLAPWEVLLCVFLLLPGMLEQHLNPFGSWQSAASRTLDPYMYMVKVWVYSYLLHWASARTFRLRRIESTRLPSINA